MIAGSSWVGQLAWRDGAHTGPVDCSLSLWQDTMPAGDWCPLTALLFNSMFSVLESWVARFASTCEYLCVLLPGQYGVVAGLHSQCAVVVSFLRFLPLINPSMDVCSLLHPPHRSGVWIQVLPFSILVPIKCVHISSSVAFWPAGALSFSWRPSMPLLRCCLSVCSLCRSP